jgi:DNA-binding transcriptional MerR regulator/methylmalonyl-CoA mutase cobalamin-binding subunit
VLRAWERRYGVVAPVRSEGGQRLYSDLDIQRLRLLRQLTERGHAISRIGSLPLESLNELNAAPDAATQSGAGIPAPEIDGTAGRDYAASALDATRRLDHGTLQPLLERAAVTLGAPEFLDHVAAPVLDEIGRGWAAGTVSVAQEHLASAVFRRVLSWLLRVYEVRGPAPRLVVSTPPGEMHELGALMVAVSAAAEGWFVVYLGPDLPASDLVEAARASGANAVALSLVHAPDRGRLVDTIRECRLGLSAGTPLLLGGAAAADLPLETTDKSVLLVEGLDDLRHVLGRLASGISAGGAT